ncbi:hemicentin-1-like [Physella acuta]|uniref:hemicentin-1-like n=1 Tax=Physella acuta TaxID=109671 RepID=UPI0027DBC56A|nr:hemicentin-1-like [Physella acuta]
MTPERKCVRFKYQNNEDHPNTPKRKKGGKLASHHTSFHYLLPLLLLLTYLPLSSCLSDPVISSPYAVLEGGKNATLTCTLSSAQLSTTSYPLIWRRDNGLPVGSSAQNYPWDSNTNTYRTELTFAPTALDNEVSIICLVFDGTDTKTASYQVSVILVPQTPNITGNLTARADVVDIWTCVVDGASYIPPNVYWRDGDGLSLTKGVNKNTDIVVVSNNNYVYKVTSTYTAALPAQSTFTLTCYVVHQMDNYYNIMKQSSININVVYPPTTTAGSLAMTVNENTRATIVCTINSNPPATTVTWTKDGVTVSGERYESFNATSPNLIIKNVSVSDAGRYNCTASNSLGSGSFTAPTMLTVNYAPVIRYNITSFTGNVGSSIVLPCPVNALPEITTIRWKRYDAGQVTTLSLTSSKYSGADVTNKDYGLKIQTLQEGDAGIYFCEAGNTLGTGTGSNLTLTVTSPVIVNVSSHYYERNEGQKVVMGCSFTPAWEVVSVFWTKNGGETAVPGNYNETYPDLVIESVAPSDSAYYQCVAVNQTGQKIISDSVTLLVNYLPKIQPVQQTAFQRNLSQSVTLRCFVNSYPAAVITWLRDNQTFDMSNSSKYLLTDSQQTLTINNLVPADEGNYFCRAANRLGTAEGQIQEVHVLSSPVVAVPYTNIVASENQPFTLTCIVTSLDNLTDFYWTKNGQRLNTSDAGHYVGGTSAVTNLNILSAQESDGGVYSCVATNSFYTTKSDNVTVTYTSIPRVNTPSQISSNESLIVVLTCNVSSSSPVTILYWTKGGQPINTSSDPIKYQGGTINQATLVLYNVSKADSGLYVCVIGDATGTTNSSAYIVTITSAPEVKVNLTNITISEGSQQFKISCEVNANPAVSSVIWLKDGQPLNIPSPKYAGGTTATPSLTINNVSRSDSGAYVCRATNSFGSSSSGAVNILVTYAPSVIVSSNEISAQAGTNATLTCAVSALPSVTNFYWTRNGTQLQTPSPKYQGGTITQTNLTIFSLDPKSDPGVYACVATNSEGTTTSSNISLTVTTVPVIKSNDTIVNGTENQSVVVHCPVTNIESLTDLYWTKDGQRLNTTNSTKYAGGTLSTPSLTIKSLSISDSGTYMCVAANAFGTVPGSNVTVDLTYRPKVAVTNSTVTVVAGQTITLNCSVDAVPAISSLSWTKSGQTINVNNPSKYSGGTTSDPSLRILSSSGSDAGSDYICIAGNTVGNTSSNPVTVVVITSPVISTTSTNVTSSENQQVTLSCEVIPLDSLTDLYWTKDGQRLDTSNTGKYSGGNKITPSLTVNSLTLADAGKYVCAANNSYGTAQSGNILLSLQYPPHVSVGNSSIQARPGETIMLTCSVDASPNITEFYWKFEQTIISSTANPTKYSGGTITDRSLKIFTAAPSDVGNYYCVASNSLGTTTSLPVNLTLNSAPVISTPITKVSANETENVTLKCEATPLDSITSFYWVKDGQQLNISNATKYTGGTNSSTNLVIFFVIPGDEGFYSCVATNSYGTSKSENITLTVLSVPLIVTPNTNITVNENQQVTLSCQVTPLNTLTELYWLKDGQRLVTSNTVKYSGGTTATPSLTILSLTPIDKGSYSCVARNSYGNSSSDIINVVVQYVPRVAVTNSTVTVVAGQTITLNCSVDAVPAISSLSWTKSGQTINVNNPSKYSGGTTSDPSLRILSSSGSDAGSDYICIAGNTVGNTSSYPVTVVVITVPVIVTPNTNITVIENQQVTLSCQVTPLNTLTELYWLKDGQRLVTSNTVKYSGGTTATPSLTILSLTPIDKGSYSCVARNSYGNSSSDVINVVVQYVPRVTVTNSTVTVIAGQTITLNCSVDAVPAISSLSWTKSGQTINVNNPSKYSGGTTSDPSLRILSSSGSDAGSDYICIAGNTVGNTSSNPVTVVVITVPVIVTPNTNITVIENQQVTLSCQVTPLNTLTELYWLKDGQRLVTSNTIKYSGGTTATPSLTILSLTPIDKGSYSCVARNSYGNSSSDVINVVVQYVPRVAVTNSTVTVVAGQTITLNCSVDAVPAISSLSWTKSGQTINVNNPSKYSGGTTSDPSLRILSSSGSDAGSDYICIAGNTVGTTSSNPVTVVVITVPVIVTPNTNITVIENQQVTLSCQVTPLNTLTELYWLKDGHRLVTNNTVKYSGGTTATPSLTILSLTPIDKGSYSCVARNSYGNSSSDIINVVVQYAPKLSATTSPVTTVSGSTIILTCNVDANPQLTDFYWRKSNSNISSTSNPEKYSGGTIFNTNLTIINTSKTDTGNYTCVAVNNIGASSSQSVSVVVNYIPVVLMNQTTISVREGTAQYTITALVDSSPAPVLLTWKKDGQVINVTNQLSKYSGATPTNPELTIKNISRSDVGLYTLTVENSIGSNSNQVPVSFLVTYPPTIYVNTSNITAKAGTNITLISIVTAFPALSSFYWTKDGLPLNTTGTSSKYSGGTVATPNLTILILDASSDPGLYACVAENDVGRVTSSALMLTVFSFPVIKPPTTTNLTGVESQQTTLECNVTPLDSLTDLYWTRNSQRLNTSNSTKYQGGTTTRPNLTILYLTDTDTGIYACVANNSFGPSQGPNSSLNIFYKPKLTVVTDPISLKDVGFVSLTCSISANPAITSFNWTKIGVGAINSSANTSKYSGGTTFNPTLTIYLLSAQDSGNYTCGAANSIGSTVSSVVVLNVISSPQVTVSPTSDTKPEGTPEFVLSCTVLAIPAIKNLTWQKDGAVMNLTGQSSKYSGGVISQPNLTIKNLTRYDAGVYVCQATNDNGSGQSAGAQLNVTFQPTISGGPGSVQAADDKNVTLTCSVASYPPLTSLYWTKDEVPINTTQNPNKYFGGTVSVPDLTIIKLNKTTDVGSYKCVARNSVGNTTSPAVNLTITYDPYISVNQTSITAEEGKPFTIFINEVKIYPSTAGVTWFKDGQQINLDANRNKYTGGILNSSSLTVLNASKSDSGTYKLQATNGSKTVDSPTITVSVIYPPKVSGNSSTETTSGATISLVCTVDANPSITSLSWTKTVNGVSAAVVYDARLSGGNVTNPDLKIAGVAPSDAGSYRCVAGNTLGNTTGPTSIITVKYKPTVEVRTSPTSVVVGQRMDLLCTVTAYPAASRVSWSKIETVETEVSTTSTYVIRNATYTDYMEYRCSATNTEGTSSATIKPNITFNPQQSGTGEETVQTNVPADLTLECTVVANPEPTSYSWFNGTNLMPQYTQKTITLRITSASDYGVYSCSANNSLGGLNPARTFTVTNKGSKLKKIILCLILSKHNSSFVLTFTLHYCTYSLFFPLYFSFSSTIGSSTGSSGLSTATIILIVIIIVILLIIIILLLIFCCLQGVFAKCCKKKESGKVAPVNGSAPPMKAALSNPIFASDPKISINDDVPVTPRRLPPMPPVKPNVIISVPAPDGAKPHHLPPFDPVGEKATEKFYRDQRRRSRKKKKERKQENNEDEKALTGNGTDGSTPSLEKIGVSTA